MLFIPAPKVYSCQLTKLEFSLKTSTYCELWDIEIQKFTQKLAVVAALALEISLILIRIKGGKLSHKMLSAVCEVAEPVSTVGSKPILYHIEFVVEVQVNTVVAVQMMLIFIVVGE
jgi:hypothetical protein